MDNKDYKGMLFAEPSPVSIQLACLLLQCSSFRKSRLRACRLRVTTQPLDLTELCICHFTDRTFLSPSLQDVQRGEQRQKCKVEALVQISVNRPIQVSVGGMTCMSCVAAVEKAVLQSEGVLGLWWWSASC